MPYRPKFAITPALLTRVEAISALRERIQNAKVQVAWIPGLQTDSRARNVHSSTAIEGNPLTLDEVRAIEQQGEPAVPTRSRREVVNYFAALRHIEQRSSPTRLTHDDVFRLHSIIAGDVMDQGVAGRYRLMHVRVGPYVPPKPEEIERLMLEFLEWWNQDAPGLSPVLSSAIVHYRFEAIHPFADGNGRTGRALALWELYRRGFDNHHIFSVDEFYWEDRPRYYAALREVPRQAEDLTTWLEYCAEGLYITLERAWNRIQQFTIASAAKPLLLRPKQEQLLQLLRVRGSLTPRELWDALSISKQGAMDLIRPLMSAGLIRRTGTQKSGRYVLDVPRAQRVRPARLGQTRKKARRAAKSD